MKKMFVLFLLCLLVCSVVVFAESDHEDNVEDHEDKTHEYEKESYEHDSKYDVDKAKDYLHKVDDARTDFEEDIVGCFYDTNLAKYIDEYYGNAKEHYEKDSFDESVYWSEKTIAKIDTVRESIRCEDFDLYEQKLHDLDFYLNDAHKDLCNIEKAKYYYEQAKEYSSKLEHKSEDFDVYEDKFYVAIENGYSSVICDEEDKSEDKYEENKKLEDDRIKLVKEGHSETNREYYYEDDDTTNQDIEELKRLIAEQGILDGETCSGCIYGDRCLDTGVRLLDGEDSVYCDFTGEIQNQKEEGVDCQNDFECATNSCSSGECIDLKAQIQENRNLIQRIIDFLVFWK